MMRHAFVTSQAGPYSQFKRALGRRNFMVAWTLAAELPKLSLADALSLVLLARDSGKLRRFEGAAVRWHALLCLAKRLAWRVSAGAGGDAAMPEEGGETTSRPGPRNFLRSMLLSTQSGGRGRFRFFV
jgi:hypothetical protein